MLLISSKAEFPTDAIDMFLDSRIQKIVSVALICYAVGCSQKMS